MTSDHIVGIRFVEAGPITYCSPGDHRLGLGDYVIVSTDRGERLGWVVLTPDQVVSARLEGPLRVVDRLATAEEIDLHRQRKRQAEEDVSRAQSAASRIDPRVRVAAITYDLAGGYAELTFTAGDSNSDLVQRVQREVEKVLDVPDLLVEQVGDRDRAKAIGGLGVCGRALCCATWMTEFPAISIKMAKDQGLAPNPSKISGVCGRLLCCLAFEVDAYREIVGSLPKVGKRITTPIGKAKVLSINALTELVRLRFDDTGQIVEISTEAVKRQMGTAIRPEELDAEIEEALRDQDRRRQANLVAVLQPVDRPLRETDATPELERAPVEGRRPASPGRRAPAARPAPARPEPVEGRAADQRRRRRGAPGRGNAEAQPRSEGNTANTANTGTTEQRSGIRITRRRRPDQPSPQQPGQRSQPARPSSAHPEPVEGRAAAEGQRRRRRGRRGGRRRGGSAGDGGSGSGGPPAAD